MCVIDLDTVMPGTACHDFGDAVRSAACGLAEDGALEAGEAFDIELFEGLARGYLGTARRFLVDAEWRHLAVAARSVTFVIGVRFLTDYLLGDVYFRARHGDQNLRRARTQFAMVAGMERHASRIDAILAALRESAPR